MSIVRSFFTITPFFLICCGLFLYAIFMLIQGIRLEGGPGWGTLVFFIFIAITFAIAAVDIGMKLFISSSKMLIFSQLGILIVIALYSLLSEVKQTLQLPKDFDKNYVTIIFDIDNQPKIPNRFIPFQQPILVDDDGYLQTSTKLPRFAYGDQKFILKNAEGIALGSDASNYGYITFHVYSIVNQGKNYKYLTFKIQPKENCCGWSSQEINEHHEEVAQYLKTHLN